MPSYLATGSALSHTVTISATLQNIDGVGGVLGSAGPTTTTALGGFTVSVTGDMDFDTSDIAVLEANNEFGI